jgi:hypothetical protein
LWPWRSLRTGGTDRHVERAESRCIIIIIVIAAIVTAALRTNGP